MPKFSLVNNKIIVHFAYIYSLQPLEKRVSNCKKKAQG